jgi:hypothetical protein
MRSSPRAHLRAGRAAHVWPIDHRLDVHSHRVTAPHYAHEFHLSLRYTVRQIAAQTDWPSRPCAAAWLAPGIRISKVSVTTV